MGLTARLALTTAHNSYGSSPADGVINMEDKKRKITEKEMGEGEYIKVEDGNEISTKNMRLYLEEEINKMEGGKDEASPTEVGAGPAVGQPSSSAPILRNKSVITGKTMTRKEKKLFRKKANQLARKIKLGLFNSRETCSLPSDEGVQSLEEAGAASKPAVVELANNERLVIDTNASFLTSMYADMMIIEDKKRKITKEEIGEGEYIEEKDDNKISTKKMRLDSKEEIDKIEGGKDEASPTDVGPVPAVGQSSSSGPILRKKSIATGKTMTRREKRLYRKKANQLARKFKLRLFNNRETCSLPCDEGVQNLEVAAASSSKPAEVVELANNERLAIDTGASFITPTPDASRMINSSSSSCGGGGAILCLDVEVLSDGTYSQFSQLGAVLLAEGRTSYFEAKVGAKINGV
jgi:hypothetical protein